MNAPPVRIAVAGMTIAALIAALLGVAHIARRQQVIRLGYELSRVIEDLSRKQEENRRLRLEKATLTNPQRIQTLARSLGMTQPGPHQIQVIRTVSTVATTSGLRGEMLRGDSPGPMRGEPGGNADGR